MKDLLREALPVLVASFSAAFATSCANLFTCLGNKTKKKYSRLIYKDINFFWQQEDGPKLKKKIFSLLFDANLIYFNYPRHKIDIGPVDALWELLLEEGRRAEAEGKTVMEFLEALSETEDLA